MTTAPPLTPKQCLFVYPNIVLYYTEHVLEKRQRRKRTRIQRNIRYYARVLLDKHMTTVTV
jgi:hypothetical protein